MPADLTYEHIKPFRAEFVAARREEGKGRESAETGRSGSARSIVSSLPQLKTSSDR
jgi:hypothetical protein